MASQSILIVFHASWSGLGRSRGGNAAAVAADAFKGPYLAADSAAFSGFDGVGRTVGEGASEGGTGYEDLGANWGIRRNEREHHEVPFRRRPGSPQKRSINSYKECHPASQPRCATTPRSGAARSVSSLSTPLGGRGDYN